jgi:molecular chaperone DnaK
MFNLSGIAPAPRGVPQIEVTYDIDANGLLNVSAKDLATGNAQKITITASTKLSDEQKNKAIKDAEQFAEQDRRKKEEVEVRNNADSLMYTAEKTKKDLGDKISKENTEKIDKAISELREAISKNDVAAIKAKSDALTQILQEVGTAAYQQAAAQQAQAQAQAEQQKGASAGPTTGGTATGTGSEKVVDADYKVVDDKDKKP